MKPTSIDFVVCLAVGVLMTGVAQAQEGAEAALLYSYELHDVPAFEAGYKDHLAWHQANNDKLAWYGWRVISGDRTGQFVDGTFGATFSDLDARPLPGQDAAHFAQHVSPFASPTGQAVFRLWSEASTTHTLEDHLPTRFLDVYFIDVRPGRADEFEAFVRSYRKNSSQELMTWYRAVTGADLPQYLLVLPRTTWAELGRRAPSMQPFGNAYAPQREGAIQSVRSETWAYRPSLSLLPTRIAE